MDASGVVSLVLSIAALAVSVVFALKQNSLQRQTNNAAALIDLLGQFRSPELHKGFAVIQNDLGSYDQANGLSGLPEEVRYHVFDVCYFLQQFACLIVAGIIKEKEFTALLRARLISAWARVEPFVQYERQNNPASGPEFLGTLEAFAVKARTLSPEVGQEILQRWVARPIR